MGSALRAPGPLEHIVPVRGRLWRVAAGGPGDRRQGGFSGPLRRPRQAGRPASGALAIGLWPTRGPDSGAALPLGGAGAGHGDGGLCIGRGQNAGGSGGADSGVALARGDAAGAGGGRARLARAPAAGAGDNSRSEPRHPGKPVAALPDDIGPALGTLRLLPAERCLWVSRPAAGLPALAGPESGPLPGADSAPRRAPVWGRRSVPLVAPFERAGPRHQNERRPPLAGLRGRQLPQGDKRLLDSRGAGALRRRPSPGAAGRACAASLRPGAAAHRPAGAALHRRRRLERRAVGGGSGGAGRIGVAGAVSRRLAGRLGGNRPAHRRRGHRTGLPRLAGGARHRHQRPRLGRRVVPALGGTMGSHWAATAAKGERFISIRRPGRCSTK